MALYNRAPDVFEIEIERQGLSYRVGDCTLLIREGGIDSRPYSFSSHPDEPVLRFLVRRMEGKASDQSFSRWLAGLEPGDSLEVGTPFGWFRPGQSQQEVWFATGTGVSPFLAALRANRPLRPLSLFIGVRGPQEAILRTWVEERSPVHWAFSQYGSAGTPPRRVTDFMDHVPIAPEIGYFLCGNQRMIREVAALLKGRGAASSQIHEELFFQ